MHHQHIFGFSVLLLVTFCISGSFCLPNKTKDVPETVTKRQARIGPADFFSCYISKDLGCFLDIGDRFVEQKRYELLAQEQFEGRASGGENPTDLSNSIARIFTEITDVFKDGFLGFFRTAKEDDDSSSDIEAKPVGEARKKKKKGKLIALIKLIILGVVLKALITLKLKALSAALQVKFFLVALAGLILNAARFYLDLKKGHQPQKVIYYEHAQHQHHYDGAEDDWGGSSGGGGSYWGRSYDEDPQNIAYAKQKPVAHTTNKSSWLG